MEWIVIAGSIISFLGFIPYLKDTIKGTTKPNRMTWALWAVAPLIAAIAGLSSGVTWAVLPVFMAGFGPLLVLFVSFRNKNSYWKLSKFDYICGATSVLALILWSITKNPSLAILLAISSDLLAAIPTMLKSWTHPYSETYQVFLFSMIGNLTAFLVMKQWNFNELAFPIYLILVCLTMTLIIVLRRKFLPAS